jgi:hypothetical protein
MKNNSSLESAGPVSVNRHDQPFGCWKPSGFQQRSWSSWNPVCSCFGSGFGSRVRNARATAKLKWMTSHSAVEKRLPAFAGMTTVDAEVLL